MHVATYTEGGANVRWNRIYPYTLFRKLHNIISDMAWKKNTAFNSRKGKNYSSSGSLSGSVTGNVFAIICGRGPVFGGATGERE